MFGKKGVAKKTFPVNRGLHVLQSINKNSIIFQTLAVNHPPYLSPPRKFFSLKLLASF